MNDSASQLERIASRANTLYSRPTVAMELVRLAEQEQVDAKAIRDCVALDPGLACKILRVVNSSLYGLNRPVADLNQAIGLLGIKSLELLALGFSLPDALFAEVAARELEWYWTNTLTRAVSARLLAEQLYHRPGDEAFTAGLLQDIGILVLLHELGEPYAKFLTGIIEEKCHLAALEQDILGFDHIQLSSALLTRWQLPERVVEAIAMPKRPTRLARMSPPEADLPQILHLAELLTQLVGQRRLSVLPELLESGKEYRGMTKSKLEALVEGLQPQVDQLGEVLSLELSEKRDYVRMLLEAHRRMAALSEQMAGNPPAGDMPAYAQLLNHTRELTGAMQSFLCGGRRGQLAPHGGISSLQHASEISSSIRNDGSSELALRLVVAATRCRDRRQELSLLIVEPNVYDVHSDPEAIVANRQTRMALEYACSALEPNRATLVPLSDRRTAVVLANCERQGALAIARDAIAELDQLVGPSVDADDRVATTLGIGVATSSVVPKNFDAHAMIESAIRCLSAARCSGTSAVKSIEV